MASGVVSIRRAAALLQREPPVDKIFAGIVSSQSRPLLSPLPFFFLSRQLGCRVSSQCLTSPHVQTFLGIYKQLSQPREAFVDCFPACINIYQPGKHSHMSAMRR